MAEIVFANQHLSTENYVGVRADGSLLVRSLRLHIAEPAGGDFGRMHVGVGGASTIELYHEDVSDPHQFLLTGYWGEQIRTPRVLTWQEIEPQ